MAHHENQKSDLKIGLLGLSIGLVWILVVGAISYFMAL